MAQNIAAALKVDLVIDAAMTAFKKRLAPLGAFSTKFERSPLTAKAIMQVPFYPLAAGASTDFVAANGYVMGHDTDLEARTITVNKRKYQSLTVSSSAAEDKAVWDEAKLGELKGNKLAEDVLADILSVVTLANFGAASFTGAATGFNNTVVVQQLRLAAQNADWPEMPRSLIVNPAYDAFLLSDSVAANQLAATGSTELLKEGKLGRISGFDYYSPTGIPANAQNLVGFIAHPAAILVGIAPVEPHSAVRDQLTRYEIVSDEVTGLSFTFREWGNPDMDQMRSIIECRYGYITGDAAALKRIVSA